MRMNRNRKILSFMGRFLIIIIIAFIVIFFHKLFSNNKMIGGILHAEDHIEQYSIQADSLQINDYNERFQRPSKQTAISNPYSLQTFTKGEKTLNFRKPADVVYAYFGILKEASNMVGYSGGCGTIGDADIPYPYAYQLLSAKARKDLSLQKFKDSFKGIGHITLLQVHSLPSPPEISADIKYFITETEVITGKRVKYGDIRPEEQINYFAYYYAIITVEEGKNGWKIQKIDYFPEEFLCAPYHGWAYNSADMVNIVFKDNLKVIEKIMNTVEKDGMIYIYAFGDKHQYRFDFVRLANGHDILVNENISVNGKWRPTELLTDEWINLKAEL